MPPKRKKVAVASPAEMDTISQLEVTPSSRASRRTAASNNSQGSLGKDMEDKSQKPQNRSVPGGDIETNGSRSNISTTPHATGSLRRGPNTNGAKYEPSDSELSDPPAEIPPSKKKKQPTKSSIAAKKGSDEIKAFRAEQAAKVAADVKIKKEHDQDGTDREDPEAGGDIAEDVENVKKEAARPPPVNSEYLPLPWKGRLGYACLNTYLRLSNPPIFSSRTCRIASILEHRHPLKDETQPEHTTKNRPDKKSPADVERGRRYVEQIGLQNARDIGKMLRWNEKYGIRFMRLSSEMFPFASHEVYGYRLASFASEALAEAGKVAAEFGHRLSTHPGQFTQLGSPRPAVIENAIRDLEYHDEMLSLLKLPEQQNRDAVMVLHLGGMFGDKVATVERFKANYNRLSKSIKNRLVLENDDVSWSVHDLLPICEELNIPLVLDFHHHNIVFDSSELREGTKDIMALFPRIKATWDRKQMTQKMHYSEPCAEAVTGRQRRKHNPRPSGLPPCPNDMDLMIEAKDKEQAVFGLMRTFKLPGWDSFADVIPYERTDDNRPEPRKAKRKKTKKQVAAEIEEFGEEVLSEAEAEREEVPQNEVGMGGRENRVYWPPGMEEWLRPKKRELKKRDPLDPDDMSIPTPHNFQERREIMIRERKPMEKEIRERFRNANSIAELQAMLAVVKETNRADVRGLTGEPYRNAGDRIVPRKKRKAETVLDEVSESEKDLGSAREGDEAWGPSASTGQAEPVRASMRGVGRRVKYTDGEDMDDDMEM